MKDDLDIGVVNLAKAIRQSESGGNFSAKGKSGEHGAYQFTPDTWKAVAPKYGINVPIEQATPEQQNAVAYNRIKAWKDSGKDVTQIASMWNAGEGEPDAYTGKFSNGVSSRGTNKFGAKYDVPAYVESVAKAYQQIKGGSSVGIDPNNPSSTNNFQTKDKSFLEDVGGTATDVLKGLSQATSDSLSGKINPLSGLLQGAGAVAGGVGGLTSNVLEHLPVVGGLVKGTEDLIGKGVGAIAETKIGQDTIQGASDWAQKHPELAGDIGAIGNIASAIPIFKGFGLAKTGVRGVVSRVLGNPAEIEALTPKITGKAYEKKGLLGKVKDGAVDDPEYAQSWQSIQDAASALGTKGTKIIKTGAVENSNNLNRVIDTIRDYSQKVVSPFIKESGVNYNFGDLQKALSLVEPPPGLSGEGLSAFNRMKSNAMQAIANRISPDVKGISSLSELRSKLINGKVPEKILKGDEDFWDARKMIDDIFEKETKGKVFQEAARNGAQEGYSRLRGAFKDYLDEAFRYPGQMEKVNKLNEFLKTPQAIQMNKAGWSLEDIEKQFGLARNPMSEAKASEWEKHMKTLSGLFDARKNLSTRIGPERGLSGLDKFKKKHPVLNYAAKKTGQLAGTAVAGGIGIEGYNRLFKD